LADAADHAVLLQRVAELAVPAFADLCIIEGVEHERPTSELLAVAGETAFVARFNAIRRHSPLETERAGSAGEALTQAHAVLVSRVDDARRRQIARDEEHLRLLNELGAESAISVPLEIRGQMLGVLTLISVR